MPFRGPGTPPQPTSSAPTPDPRPAPTPAREPAQARHSPRGSWTGHAPTASPIARHSAHRSPGTTPSRRDDPPPTPCRRTAPRRRESAATPLVKLDTTSRSTTPRKRCKTPVEPPTLQGLQGYQTRTGAAERRHRTHHRTPHAGKAVKTA